MKRLLPMLFVVLACFAMTAYSAPKSSSQVQAPPRIKIRDGVSSNWSGYAVQTNLTHPQSGAVSDVKGTWTVPTVNCTTTPSSYSSAWVGIDGYSDGTVEQTGTDSDCSGSSPVYYAWYEMYPQFPQQLSLSILPGDTISAEVHYIGNGNFSLTLNDSRSGNFSITLRSKRAARSSAEWILEAPSSSGGVLPLADFGTISFSSADATLNGHTGGINDSAWQNDMITMADQSGVIKALPSALIGGTSFSVAWKRAQ